MVGAEGFASSLLHDENKNVATPKRRNTLHNNLLFFMSNLLMGNNPGYKSYSIIVSERKAKYHLLQLSSAGDIFAKEYEREGS